MTKTMKKMVAMVLVVSMMNLFTVSAFARPALPNEPVLFSDAVPLSDNEMAEIRGELATLAIVGIIVGVIGIAIGAYGIAKDIKHAIENDRNVTCYHMGHTVRAKKVADNVWVCEVDGKHVAFIEG